MSPFDFKTYREYLKAVCQHSPERGAKAAMARAAGCQASYLSQVLQERVHLTEDQLLGIIKYIDLGKQETEFLFLLLRLERAGTTELKNYINQQIEHAEKSREDLSNKIGTEYTVQSIQNLSMYFSSWIPSAIHLLTSSDDHKTVEAIAKRLRLPTKKVRETLKFLEQAGFVKRIPGGWDYANGSMHIPKASAVQTTLQTSRRELAVRSIQLNPENEIHFSSIFTLDQEDLEKIKKLAGQLVEKSHSIIRNSGTEKLACICLDVFEVL